jgi:hypothetical protein
LIRLERDKIEYFTCDIYNLLHRFDESDSFGLGGLNLEKTSRLPCVRARKWYTYDRILSTHRYFMYSPSSMFNLP